MHVCSLKGLPYYMQSNFNPRLLDSMTQHQLNDLAKEIRHTIIGTVSNQGGHLASNLGVVELTIALHSTFNAPQDKLIFDVGHQCYTHKLLTGRAHLFHTLRSLDGLCGFPRSQESIYDAFDTGHASTAISAAVGYARARDLQNETHHVVAIVGDGAMTGGMCYEALNDAGSSKTKLIVVLNDNEMSINVNVGALSKQLSKLRLSKGWLETKKHISKWLEKIPFIGEKLCRVFKRFKDNIRNIFVKDKFFSSLGFKYIGPIDGHDIESMQRFFQKAKAYESPILLHVVTKKGHGYSPAEVKPSSYHGTPPFDIESGEVLKKSKNSSYGKAACAHIKELAKQDERIVIITAAMTEGVGFASFQKAFPARVFDVGIAEEHAVTLAAGMAKGGLHPVVCLYDTFLQRGFDQVAVDVCLQNLPVLFLVDRTGLNGADGSTHHGTFGLSYLSPLPNLKILAPVNTQELCEMINYFYQQSEPIAIRYPREADDCLQQLLLAPFQIGKWQVIHAGDTLVLFCCSSMNAIGLEVASKLKKQNIFVCVVNASSIKPLDNEMITSFSKRNIPMFTLECNVLSGGLGSNVADYCIQHQLTPPVKLFTLPDVFIEHGKEEKLLMRNKLDATHISHKIIQLLKKEN